MEVLDLDGLQYLVTKLRAQGSGSLQRAELSVPKNWTRNTTNGYYSQTIKVTGMAAADRPCVFFKAPLAQSQRELKWEAFRLLFAVDSKAGSMALYASDAPQTAFEVIVEY